MKRGFTLIEILITIVILAALAAIALPSFLRTRQRTDARQAFTYLRAIRLAERMHFAKWGDYNANPPAGCLAMTPLVAATMNTCLGTEIQDGAYAYSVVAAATTFTATATRADPAETITLNQAGAWGCTPLPACTPRLPTD